MHKKTFRNVNNAINLAAINSFNSVVFVHSGLFTFGILEGEVPAPMICFGS